jgi:hypothetical protein
MMTRCSSLIALAGLASGFLVTGGLGLPQQVSAQPTQTEIKQKRGVAAKKAATKWDSLTPEQ